MTQTRSPITTHILDLNSGTAAAKIPVRLEILSGPNPVQGQWKTLGQASTGEDGRIESLLPAGSKAEAGTYRMTFETEDFFKAKGITPFYPSVVVTFRLDDSSRHHHIPLLLSPYGYSTYRGT
jgi:5-hydroxyisourate hydrolase